MRDGRDEVDDCLTALSLARDVLGDPKASEEQRRRAEGVIKRCEARIRNARGTLGFAPVKAARA